MAAENPTRGGDAEASSSGNDSIVPSTSQQQKQQRESFMERLANMLVAPKHKEKSKERYAFWETQPVVQFSDAPTTSADEDGPIDALKMVDDIRKEPYVLPTGFEWCECDISDPAEVKELYELLHLNYVEDDDAMFRFNYSPAFLQWALQPPGFRPDWHVGVRSGPKRRLVAFISAIPAAVLVNAARVSMVEINFLCVHKKLRSKRLAPVLIKEITRRVNLTGIWQAAYTAGVVLPRPVASCRYWHRSLNPKKLIDVNFSALAPRMTLARTIKLYKLPPAPSTPGLRPMERRDVPAVTQLLNNYLARYRLTQHFSEEEVDHWLLPRELVVDAYVVQRPAASGATSASGNSTSGDEPASDGAGVGDITDLVSFYTLPSSVLGHSEHSELRAAYMFYTVPGSVAARQLLGDAMILAAAKGYDVFNALDLLENATFLKDLKFGPGDGLLQYYLYNWRTAGSPMPSSEVGLILL